MDGKQLNFGIHSNPLPDSYRSGVPPAKLSWLVIPTSAYTATLKYMRIWRRQIARVMVSVGNSVLVHELHICWITNCSSVLFYSIALFPGIKLY